MAARIRNVTSTNTTFLQNSLRLGISPRPNTLTERRQIYHHLQQYGEILYFKSNFYDRTIYSPDSTLLIFREKQSYDRLIAESPLSIQIDRRTFDPLSLHWTYTENARDKRPLDPRPRKTEFAGPGDLQKPAHNSTPFLQLYLNPVETAEEKQAREERQIKKYLEQKAEEGIVQFKITATPFKGNQRSYLEYTPYWGPFKIRHSMIQRDLAKDVPVLGLSDVDVHKRAAPLWSINKLRWQLGKKRSLRELYDEAQMRQSS